MEAEEHKPTGIEGEYPKEAGGSYGPNLSIFGPMDTLFVERDSELSKGEILMRISFLYLEILCSFFIQTILKIHLLF